MKKAALSARYQRVAGGLFAPVTKADVGNAADEFASGTVTLLGWADPFYPDPAIPPHLQQVLHDAVDSGFPAHYTMPIGSLALRRAVSEKLRRFNGIAADPQRNILITPGSDSGLYYALSVLLDQGDEVLIPDPSYPNNYLDVQLLGGVPVPVPLAAQEGYALDLSAFQRALTPRTKAVILTHPNNPTTTVFPRTQLAELARFIMANGLFLVVDQAFEDSVFDGIEFVSPAALPDMWERTITVCSISKGMGLSGFRVGYLVACERIMDVLYGAAVNVLGATNTLSQILAEAALKDDGFMRSYVEIFQRRRKIAYELFSKIPGVKMLLPQSAFFSWLDVSALGDSAFLTQQIFEQGRVVVNDGRNYGRQGVGCLRVIHGCLGQDEELSDALERVAAVLTLYVGR